MKQEKLELLFSLVEELYGEEQKKSGMLYPQPYCWAKHETRGVIVFNPFAKTPAQLFSNDKTKQGKE